MSDVQASSELWPFSKPRLQILLQAPSSRLEPWARILKARAIVETTAEPSYPEPNTKPNPVVSKRVKVNNGNLP